MVRAREERDNNEEYFFVELMVHKLYANIEIGRRSIKERIIYKKIDIIIYFFFVLYTWTFTNTHRRCC